MRLVLITVITLQLLLEERLSSTAALPQGSSTDPCDEAPCGKGAECKSMGSIAICVCPNDGRGDPFVSCMEQVENEQGSSTTPPSSSFNAASQNQNQFIASFDVGSVHEQARATPATVKTTTTSKAPGTTRPTTISSTMPPSTSTTTTRSPYVHVFDSSTSRPATVGHGHHGSPTQPESHRIPIITHQNNYNRNHYPNHEYAPRPIAGGSSTHSSTYSYYGSSSPSSSSTSYDLFNEKTVVPGSGPIADYGGGNMAGGTTPYMYRGTATHMSGSQNAFEYDSRPITPTTSSYPYQHHSPPSHSNNNNIDRYGHHSYHPSSSGFPDPITESSASYSRFASASTGGMRGPSSSSSMSGSTYDVYNYNPLRNDLSPQGHHHQGSVGGGFDRIADPMGKYANCRSVNGIVVCADNSNAYNYYHSRDPTPLYDRGELKTTTVNNYGFHSNRDRDQYSSYYPSRHASSTSHRPMSDYAYDVNRQGYPYDRENYHGSRQPIDSDPTGGSSSSSYYPHSFLPKEQRISAQSTLTISPSSGSDSSTAKHVGRNDNDHPLCKSMCGINSICRLVLDRPVCGCPEGHTGDPSVRCSPTYGTSGGSIGEGSGGGNEQCQRHVDCKQSEICAKNKCIDPCKEQGLMSSSSVNFIGIGGGPGGGHTICGTNAECLVVGHTPVCKCHQGNFGNPYVACVP